jgi:diguanylate cyclase (GGDEF)-like protein
VAELEQVASTDKLTGAWNRHRLEEGVRSEMDRLNRYQHPLSLLLLDIDCFKPINDQHGHAAGDAVLQRLTTLLQAKLRSADSLAAGAGRSSSSCARTPALDGVAMLAERLRGTSPWPSFRKQERSR